MYSLALLLAIPTRKYPSTCCTSFTAFASRVSLSPSLAHCIRYVQSAVEPHYPCFSVKYFNSSSLHDVWHCDSGPFHSICMQVSKPNNSDILSNGGMSDVTFFSCQSAVPIECRTGKGHGLKPFRLTTHGAFNDDTRVSSTKMQHVVYWQDHECFALNPLYSCRLPGFPRRFQSSSFDAEGSSASCPRARPRTFEVDHSTQIRSRRGCCAHVQLGVVDDAEVRDMFQRCYRSH